ncbi:MAG: DMT family transporter [Burkholderiaceae bacterium]
MHSPSAKHGSLSLQIILLGICFSALWSSAFTTARYIVIDAPPFLSLVLRFLIAGTIGVAVAFALGQRMAFSRRHWLAILVLGFFQNTIYLGFCFLAVQWVDVSIVVIIASMLPLLVAGAHWLFMGEPTSVPGVAGLLLGLAGVVLIMVTRLEGGADLSGIIVTFIGVLALAGATLLVGSSFAGNPNLLMIVGLQMLVGSLTTLPFSYLFETWSVNWTASLVMAFAWTTLMPGLLATLIWFVMLGRIGPTRAAAFHFLNPFFGVAIAAVFLGEPLSLTDFIGVAIIMVSILVVQVSRSKTSRSKSA